MKRQKSSLSRGVGCPECERFGIWDVWDVGCGMFAGMWNVGLKMFKLSESVHLSIVLDKIDMLNYQF